MTPARRPRPAGRLAPRAARALLVPVAAPLLATGLAVSLLAGCSSDGDDPQQLAANPSPSPTGTPSAPVGAASSPAVRFPTYVALGDSFTAAPLVTEPVDTAGCLRSAGNYPARVAETLGAELEDRSCTGADTSNLTGPQRTLTGAVPPQLDALQEDTSLVTLGIGGNDYAIFSTLVACAKTGREDPNGSPCLDELGPGRVAELERGVDAVESRVRRALQEIARRSPEAEVVLVGYPQVIPPDATCPDRLPVAEGDHGFVAGLNTRLSRSMQRAAESTGTPFVDLYSASDEHDLCSDRPWINGPESTTGEALAFHPVAAEQKAVAKLVLAALDEETEPAG